MAKKTKSGKFKGAKKKTYRGPDAREALAKHYYDTHKKTVDRALEKYKETHPSESKVSNEKIFVDKIKYGHDFNSAKTAKQAMDRMVWELSGKDTDYFDARHGANSEILGNLKRLPKNPRWHDMTFKGVDDDGNKYIIDGYYETNDPDIIIASKTVKYGDDSPESFWEYQYLGDID